METHGLWAMQPDGNIPETDVLSIDRSDEEVCMAMWPCATWTLW